MGYEPEPEEEAAEEFDEGSEKEEEDAGDEEQENAEEEGADEGENTGDNDELKSPVEGAEGVEHDGTTQEAVDSEVTDKEAGTEESSENVETKEASVSPFMEKIWSILTGPDAFPDIANNAGSAFLPTTTSKELPINWVCTTLFLAKNGFGMNSLNFALRACDWEEKGTITEKECWTALTRCATKSLDLNVRQQCRRAWRVAYQKKVEEDKLRAQEEEEGEEEYDDEDEENAEEQATAPPMPVPNSVGIDTLLEEIQNDTLLADIFALNDPIEIPVTIPEEEQEEYDD